MSLAIIHSRAQVGIEALPVQVEVHLANGLPALNLVGLPETAVKESKDRVRAAITNARFSFPSRRITINLAPADLPKEGGRFDLPIALGILVASGQLQHRELDGYEFIGELGLGGELRPVAGALPMSLRTKQAGRGLILPQANAGEASLVEGARLHAANHLLEVCAHLQGQQSLPLFAGESAPRPNPATPPDIAEIKGQHQAKRALEVAAAGGHSLLLVGPPGTGKTMLASRLPHILPPMEEQEAIDTAVIASISGRALDPHSWRQRPFRAPHHTASAVALVGGGSTPRPGEISLAHNGVMFLDELPEFDRRVLEVMREPLESGAITISRAARQAEFPARFQLVAAMNPCPCGYLGETRCHCSPEQIRRYRAKLSGPLLDRIDMHVQVPRLPREQLFQPTDRQPAQNGAIQERVIRARSRQIERGGRPNQALSAPEVDRYCRLRPADQQLLEQAVEGLGLSARAYHRILRVARTIADLHQTAEIHSPHLTEAISYRQFDRTT